MTALCSGGGPSQPKPGFDRILYMAPGTMATLFNNVPTPWAIAWVAYIGYVSYDLSTFCLTDPPPDPNVTGSDLAKLIPPILDPIGYATTIQKMRDLVGHYLWSTVCQCVTGPQPPQQPAIPEPTGAPTIQPNVGPDIGSTPCLSVTGYAAGIVGGSTTVGPNRTVPAGATSLRISNNWTANAPQIRDTNVRIETIWSTPNGTNILNVQEVFLYTPAMSGEVPWDVHIPANAGSLTLQVGVPTGTWGGQGHANESWYCNGASPTGSPCDNSADINALLSMLDYIRGQVDLIQRQSVPFATVGQVIHSGLSGSGHIDVNGLIGCKFTVTSLPGSVGVYEGDTDELFDIGWFNWVGPDGASPRAWIGASPQVSYPRAAGAYTRISYSLRPGVVVELQEIRREF
jgi:hypothetical protein